MRLKPGPFTESAAVFCGAWAIVLIFFSVMSGSLDAGLRASSASVVLFLLLSYVLRIAIGFAIKKKGRIFRFFISVSITSLVTVAISIFVILATQNSSGGMESLAASTIAAVGSISFIGELLAGVFTYFVMMRPKPDAVTGLK